MIVGKNNIPSNKKLIVLEDIDDEKRITSSINLKHYHKILKKESNTSITDSKLQNHEKETITNSKINSSLYNADVSITSSSNKELAHDEETACKSNQHHEVKSVRKESVDSSDAYIIRNEHNNHFYNYEEIFEIIDEAKEEIEFDKKSVKSLKQKKRKKNVEIYISDQEEKIYNPYKDELTYLEKMNKENKTNNIKECLTKDHEEKKDKKEKPCFLFCCSII